MYVYYFFTHNGTFQGQKRTAYLRIKKQKNSKTRPTLQGTIQSIVYIYTPLKLSQHSMIQNQYVPHGVHIDTARCTRACAPGRMSLCTHTNIHVQASRALSSCHRMEVRYLLPEPETLSKPFLHHGSFRLRLVLELHRRKLNQVEFLDKPGITRYARVTLFQILVYVL